MVLGGRGAGGESAGGEFEDEFGGQAVEDAAGLKRFELAGDGGDLLGVGGGPVVAERISDGLQAVDRVGLVVNEPAGGVADGGGDGVADFSADRVEGGEAGVVGEQAADGRVVLREVLDDAAAEHQRPEPGRGLGEGELHRVGGREVDIQQGLGIRGVEGAPVSAEEHGRVGLVLLHRRGQRLGG